MLQGVVIQHIWWEKHELKEKQDILKQKINGTHVIFELICFCLIQQTMIIFLYVHAKIYDTNKMSWKVFTLPSASVATPWNHLKNHWLEMVGNENMKAMVASTRLYSMHGLLMISPLMGFTREAEWAGDMYQEIYFKELVEQLWAWLGIHRARKGRLELWFRINCVPQLEFLLRSLGLLWLTHTQISLNVNWLWTWVIFTKYLDNNSQISVWLNDWDCSLAKRLSNSPKKMW